MAAIRVALVGDHSESVLAHRAIPLALAMAGQATGHEVSFDWIGTETLAEPVAPKLAAHDAVWCVPASPYRSMAGALAAIRLARQSGRPFLGTCGGYQHALIEIVRNVAGHAEADHAESNPDATLQVVTPLACSLVEQEGEIAFTPGSRLNGLLPGGRTREGYHCSYGFDAAHHDLLDGTGVVFTGFDDEGQARAFELDGHPFFVGTLFQPERAALKGRCHPIVVAFVAAAATRARPAATKARGEG